MVTHREVTHCNWNRIEMCTVTTQCPHYLGYVAKVLFPVFILHGQQQTAENRKLFFSAVR